MAKKRKRKGGTGSVITLRRLRGVGSLKNPKTFMGAALPPLIGGGVTGLTTLATRYWAKPSEGETPAMMYKQAPLLGLGGGTLASVALYWLGGAPAMIASMVSSVATAGLFMAHDHLIKNQLAEFTLALPPTPSTTEGGTQGLGVVVPQRIAGTGAMMLEPAINRDPYARYGVGSYGAYGEDVNVGANLSGINPSAFGGSGLGR